MVSFFKSLFSSDGNSLSTAAAKARIDSDKTLVILDVRQPDEFRAGHIVGAKLIPLNELQRRLSELPKDRDILCVCRSGSRSSSATRLLNTAGYRALNLSGGMIGWQNAGLPVKKGS